MLNFSRRGGQSAAAAAPARGVEGNRPGGFLDARGASTLAIDLCQSDSPPLLPDHQAASPTIAGPQFNHGSGACLLKIGEFEVAGSPVSDPEPPVECVDHVVGDAQGGFLAKTIFFGLFAVGGEIDGSIGHRTQARG